MEAFNHTALMCFSPYETPQFTVLDVPGVLQVVVLTISILTFVDYAKTHGPDLIVHTYRHAKGVMKDIPISLLATILQNQKERQWGVHY